MLYRFHRDPTTAHLGLDDWLYDAAQAGAQAFVGALVSALEGAGLRVRMHRDNRYARVAGRWRRGLTLNHMIAAPQPLGLTFRRCYFAPFWQIERSPHRWRRDIAGLPFEASSVPADDARAFFLRWQTQLFPLAAEARREGFLYLPLQGKLLQSRSFQACSPVEMIARVLARDPRPVRATLHPRQRYSRRERTALRRLAARHPRFEVSDMPMTEALARCDAVITQNSSVAFAGLFHAKPAVVFAETDFHHAVGSILRQGEDAAFARLTEPGPDIPAYLYWFLQEQAINAGRPEAEQRIADRLRALGWPV